MGEWQHHNKTNLARREVERDSAPAMVGLRLQSAHGGEREEKPRWTTMEESSKGEDGEEGGEPGRPRRDD